jgi:hypothetical protein
MSKFFSDENSKDVDKIYHKNLFEPKIIQKQNSSNKLVNCKHLAQQSQNFNLDKIWPVNMKVQFEYIINSHSLTFDFWMKLIFLFF